MVYYTICQGEGCHQILVLPYERFKNVKYCSFCRDKIRKKQDRERKRTIRELQRNAVSWLMID